MQILGSKKGQSQPQKPHIAKDDLNSTSFFKGLYGLCEGEIEGLVDGGKSIKLDGTPLINANGQPNFKGVTWDFRAGTLDQSHISGFPAVENEQNIGVELRHDRPYTKAITNKELSAVRVRLNLNALREQKDNGDITGYAIEYAIDLQTDTGAFVEVLRQPIRGKASNSFKRSHRIDLPPAKKGWTIRIRRITPNRDSDLVADTMTVDAITEIIDAKLAYPCTALLGLTYDAKTFNNIAKLAVRLKGKIIQVPTNYNPQTRQYTGLWDGTFKVAYSNNPAWVFYDLCTHRRYGLGERLAGLVDKWRLYQIGQYCDELVDDGKGGKEPRFTVNVYIQKAEDAYKVLQNLASVFRGMSFWDGQNIVVDSDTPKEPVYTFSPANIVGGEFSYTGTRARDRNTAVKVAWDNPDNDFKTEYEAVQDEEGIATQGLRMLDINAFGCTSLGQAQRAGLWALKSEQLETRSVTFKTGLQGFIPQVGQIINIADNVFAGRAISGRIVNVNGKQITLDRVAGKIGDTLTVATADGVLSSKITAINGETLTLQQTLNVENQSVWAIVADDLKLMQFRVLTIEQLDNATFSITALQYEPQKFDVVDNGVHITPQPYSVLKATPITAPNSVTLTASSRTVQGQAVTTLTINWEQVAGATAYIVKWRKDDGNWQTLPKISGQSVDIDGVYAGKYLAQVQAVDSFDSESLPARSVLTTINGKFGKPPRLAKLVVKGILFGMELNWTFARGSDDTNFTEIQVSPDGRSNIASLGTFSYPTNSHTINGLQGNLTQFYRARIVDKLGNTSDWTAWTKGVTDSSADKVLDLLNGQITQSQLHQDLVTPIAKIPTLETGITAINGKLPTLENSIASINGQLPTLNGQIATLSGKATTLQNELNTAKNTLQTAVNNITTERNRINTAIRDITALQTANNAKTQEIANLTQTMSGHTSSIRELGVTTGDLTQKYSQLKTASDTANSEITAIKQTQNGQATSIERLGANFDNLAVGGRNYAEDGNFSRGLWFSSKYVNSDATFARENGVLTINGTTNHWKQWQVQSKEGTRANLANTSSALALLQDGETYTLSIEARSDSDTGGLINLKIADDRVAGSTPARIDVIGKSNIALTTEWKRYFVTGIIRKSAEHNVWRIILEAHGATQPVYFRNVKLEKGSIPTDWTPAPEDTQSQLDEKASTASLNEFKQASANADTALGERVTAIDTAYKQADTATNAKLANAEKAISDNNTALSQRITALDTAYKSADNNLTARLAREETARASGDTANAQAIRTLESTVSGIGGRVGTSESKIATLERTTSDTNQALATAQSQLNARFDNLAVGGRNLLLGTAFDNLLSWDNWGANNVTREIENKTLRLVADNNQAWRGIAQMIRNIEPNQDYMIGFYAKSNVGNLRFGYHYRRDNNTNINQYWHDIVLNNEFTFYTIPFQKITDNELDKIYFMFGGNSGKPFDIEIKQLKFEKGTIPTDWTPAPEDVQADIDSKATTANLASETTARTNADTALGQRIDSLQTDYNGNKASVANQLKTLSDKDTATANQISSLTANVTTAQNTANTANGKADTATTKADNAQRTANDAVSRANTANSAITAEQKARADADTALGQRITAIDTAYKSADSQTVAKLGQIEQSISDKDRAMSQRVDTLNANYTALDNRTKWVELTAVTDLNTLTETGKYFIKNTNNPNSPTPPHWLFVEVDKGTNERIKQTVIQDNNVKNQWVRHCLGGNWGQWEKVATGSDLNQKADAVALNSLTTKVNQVDGKITAEAQKVSTLQTTVNGQTTSIQQQATSIDGLKAQYTVKIDSGGRVSGFGLASGGGVSDFSVRADKFLIAPPSGNGKGDSPFMVLTKSTNINGTVVPSGTYIKSAYIANGTIDNLKVKDGAITTAKIAEASITTAKIMDLAVDTIKIQDRAVTVPHTFTDTNPRNFENKRFDSFEKSETGRTIPEISEWVLHGLTPNTEIMVIVDVGRLSMFIRRPDNIAYSKDYDCAVRLGVGYMTALRPDDWDILNHSQALPTLIAHPHQGYPMPIASSTTATQLSGAFFRRLTVPEDGTVDLNLWCATYGSVDDRTIITAKTDKVTWYVLELKK